MSIYLFLFNGFKDKNLNNLKCSIFLVPVIPGLCPSVTQGWARLGQLTIGCNFKSCTDTVHWVKSLYPPSTSLMICGRRLNTWVKYLRSKHNLYEKMPESAPVSPISKHFQVWRGSERGVILNYREGHPAYNKGDWGREIHNSQKKNRKLARNVA